MATVLFANADEPGTTPHQPREGGLKILVITGEDAVNIIQQKTAVAPIVEVRDRNDQPVSGAIVSFAIRSGRATFGSARTLSVTTDVVGRAAASGLTPTGSGALQISASAAFQGQTAAVTIAQTNVLTAAEAAAIGSTGGAGSAGGAGAGGAAGGGGGLNGLTIGLIAGGAGAGALVAVKAASGQASSSPTGGGGVPQLTSRLYSVAFTPGFAILSQCNQIPATPGNSIPFTTNITVLSDGSFSGNLFEGPIGSSTPAIRLTGRMAPTDLTGTMTCIAGGGPTGTIMASGTATQYQGTWAFGNTSGTFTAVPQ